MSSGCRGLTVRSSGVPMTARPQESQDARGLHGQELRAPSVNNPGVQAACRPQRSETIQDAEVSRSSSSGCRGLTVRSSGCRDISVRSPGCRDLTAQGSRVPRSHIQESRVHEVSRPGAQGAEVSRETHLRDADLLDGNQELKVPRSHGPGTQGSSRSHLSRSSI